MKKRLVVFVLVTIAVCLLSAFAFAVGNYGVDLDGEAYRSGINPFYPTYAGQCTWYAWGRVREKLGISLPNWGHARYWAENASSTYSIGDIPQANSLFIENWYNDDGSVNAYGHVLFIEKVENGFAYYSDGNYDNNDYSEGYFNTETFANYRNGECVGYLGFYRKYIYLFPPEENPPTISDVRVTNVSADGYTVSCRVSDDTRISRVEFPTWTEPGGQDDLQDPWPRGTISNGVATYRVNLSDHNYEDDCIYYTHIDAYDVFGNVTSVNSATWPCLAVNVPAGYCSLTVKLQYNGDYEKDYANNYIIGSFNIKTGEGTPENVSICSAREIQLTKQEIRRNTAYTISNINTKTSYRYTGVASGNLTGTVTRDTEISLAVDRLYSVAYQGTECQTLPNAQTKVHNQDIELTTDVPTFRNYTFIGWSTSPVGMTVEYEPGESYTQNDDIVLYPVWQEIIARGWTQMGTWHLGEDGVLTIAGTGSINNFDSYFFPDHYLDIREVNIYNGITSIGSLCFSGCSNLARITIPGSVNSIGSAAFQNCESLEYISIPKGVTAIDSMTFNNCGALKGIVLPESIIDIGEFAFYGCKSLETISIPDGVETISAAAFAGCSGLASVGLPDGLTSIGASAFKDNTSLAEISLPGSLEIIDDYAFSGCSSLPNIEIPNTVTKIGNDAFAVCKSMTSVSIPNSVTEIGEGAFSACDHLTYARLGTGVTSVSEDLFALCSALTNVEINSAVTSIGSYAFKECSSLREIDLPDQVVSIGTHAFNDCSSLTTITIPNGVTMIGDGTFEDCVSLTSVVLSGEVTEIGRAAFRGCTMLETINIPASTVTIGDYAFEECKKLQSISIPAGVTRIGKYTFYYCHSLTTIGSINNVSSIGEHAFEWCDKLQSITIPDNIEAIGEDAFYGCGGDRLASLNSQASHLLSKAGYPFRVPGDPYRLIYIFTGDEITGLEMFRADSDAEEIIIPESVTSIGEGCFLYCPNLTRVVFHDNVSIIGEDAFQGEDVIQGINVKKVAAFGSHSALALGRAGYSFREPGQKYDLLYSFKNNTVSNLTIVDVDDDITEIIIRGEVKTIGEGAFAGCEYLKDIDIPNTVTKIEEHAFVACSSLESITWPNQIKTIKDYTFRYCTGLKSVEIPDSVTEIREGAFSGCSSLENITLPIYLKAIRNYVFDDCTALKTVWIPDKVSSIGEGAFAGCVNLASIYIPQSTKSIGFCAFCWCSRLKHVYYAGDSTEWDKISIEDENDPLLSARKHYVGSPDIVLPSSLTSIESQTFVGLPKGCLVYIPESVTSIAEDAFDSNVMIVVEKGTTAYDICVALGLTIIEK